MKRKVALLVVMALVFACCFSSLSPSADNSGSAASTAQKTVYSADKALEARFLNMLNHNFVYNEDFDDAEKVINNSVIALLGERESEDAEFISQSVVSSFVSDMYGIGAEAFEGINDGFPKKDGYVYIIPRGFTKYSHKIVGVVKNEDGTYTVNSTVTADGHDFGKDSLKAVSLFVPNALSAFGYNIVYSNILTDAFDA